MKLPSKTTTAPNRGIGRKLRRAFALQAIFIGLTAILSVYAARIIIADVLIRTALEDEAAYFVKQWTENPQTPRPHTQNMTVHLEGLDFIPQVYRNLPEGFHHLSSQTEGFSAALITKAGDHRLVLEFDGERVGELAIFFGIVPLSLVLIVLYIATWLAWRFSRRAISPITALADTVSDIDPATADSLEFDSKNLPENVDHEVQVLSRALGELFHRLDDFVERERNFTRDASHELRSPITVIRLATDVLLSNPSLDDRARNSVDRIKRSALDMEELIEMLLLLARETERGLIRERVLVNEVLEEEIERARHLLIDKPVQITLCDDVQLTVEAPDKVLTVLFGNLIRNACAYTIAGDVTITVTADHVEVADTGIGMSDEQLSRVFEPFERGNATPAVGHGVGLSIVQRLSDRFDWPLQIQSRPDVGTRVRIGFVAPP